jgi:thiosulfate/3-mercaptopyruvate sulfurtransferase
MSRQAALVDADWVAEHAGDEGVVLVEVDEDTTAYDGGHIAGAIKLDWKTDLQDPVRRDFVNKEQFEKLLSEKGVSNDDTVVLYGGNNNWFAAYAYWYFKLYGHSDVRLLDGGRKKWELDARELSSETVTRPATSYTAAEPDLEIRAFRDEVVAPAGPGPPPAGGGAARRPHPHGGQRALEQGGQRRRDLQVRQRPEGPLQRCRSGLQLRHHRLLPDR